MVYEKNETDFRRLPGLLHLLRILLWTAVEVQPEAWLSRTANVVMELLGEWNTLHK